LRDSGRVAEQLPRHANPSDPDEYEDQTPTSFNMKKSRFFYLHPECNQGEIDALEVLYQEYRAYVGVCVQRMLGTRTLNLPRSAKQNFFPPSDKLSSQIVKNARDHAISTRGQPGLSLGGLAASPSSPKAASRFGWKQQAGFLRSWGRPRPIKVDGFLGHELPRLANEVLTHGAELPLEIIRNFALLVGCLDVMFELAGVEALGPGAHDRPWSGARSRGSRWWESLHQDGFWGFKGHHGEERSPPSTPILRVSRLN
jgi:hypothetical protein